MIILINLYILSEIANGEFEVFTPLKTGEIVLFLFEQKVTREFSSEISMISFETLLPEKLF